MHHLLTHVHVQGDGIDIAAHSQLLVTQKGLQPTAATGEAGEEQGKKQGGEGGRGAMAGRKSAYRAAVLASATAVSVAWAGVQISSSSDATRNNDASSAVTQRMVAADWKVPNRRTQEAALRASTTANPLDVLVIGMYDICVIINLCSLNFFNLGIAISSLVISVVSRGDDGGLVRFLRVGGQQAKLCMLQRVEIKLSSCCVE